MHALGKTTLSVGIKVGLTLGAIVNLVGCADMTEDVDGTHELAIEGINGLNALNGLPLNGLNGLNGLTALNGLSGLNGLSLNGLSAAQRPQRAQRPGGDATAS